MSCLTRTTVVTSKPETKQTLKQGTRKLRPLRLAESRFGALPGKTLSSGMTALSVVTQARLRPRRRFSSSKIHPQYRRNILVWRLEKRPAEIVGPLKQNVLGRNAHLKIVFSCDASCDWQDQQQRWAGSRYRRLAWTDAKINQDRARIIDAAWFEGSYETNFRRWQIRGQAKTEMECWPGCSVFALLVANFLLFRATLGKLINNFL